MRFISLFSGIGGIDLGLERAGMTCVAQVEIDEFCQRVLAKHWPNVPRFADVRDYKPKQGAADVVAGGFPCQPFSLAGKRGGRQDERALWPHFARIVDSVRPTWVIAENVPGLRTLGADEVLEDLEALGYACWPLVVGADDVGAPHRRKRVFIVANRQSERRSSEGNGRITGSRIGCDGAGRGAGELADSARDGQREERPILERIGVCRWPARPGQPQHEWEQPRLADATDWPTGWREQQPESSESSRNERSGDDAKTQPSVGFATNGVSRRFSRWRRAALKALGNSVVPQVAEVIGRAIMEAQPA